MQRVLRRKAATVRPGRCLMREDARERRNQLGFRWIPQEVSNRYAWRRCEESTTRHNEAASEDRAGAEEGEICHSSSAALDGFEAQDRASRVIGCAVRKARAEWSNADLAARLGDVPREGDEHESSEIGGNDSSDAGNEVAQWFSACLVDGRQVRVQRRPWVRSPHGYVACACDLVRGESYMGCGQLQIANIAWHEIIHELSVDSVVLLDHTDPDERSEATSESVPGESDGEGGKIEELFF